MVSMYVLVRKSNTIFVFFFILVICNLYKKIECTEVKSVRVHRITPQNTNNNKMLKYKTRSITITIRFLNVYFM